MAPKKIVSATTSTSGTPATFVMWVICCLKYPRHPTLVRTPRLEGAFIWTGPSFPGRKNVKVMTVVRIFWKKKNHAAHECVQCQDICTYRDKPNQRWRGARTTHTWCRGTTNCFRTSTSNLFSADSLCWLCFILRLFLSTDAPMHRCTDAPMHRWTWAKKIQCLL